MLTSLPVKRFIFLMNVTHWNFTKRFSEVYRASSIPFRFPFLTIFFSPIYVTIIFIIIIIIIIIITIIIINIIVIIAIFLLHQFICYHQFVLAFLVLSSYVTKYKNNLVTYIRHIETVIEPCNIIETLILLSLCRETLKRKQW